MQVERLEIPITGNFGEVKLCVYPASGNAMLFEEEDAVDYGESKWQLQEGCTYEYELVSEDGRTYQFMKEDEIVRFSHSPRHPNAGTLKTGIYVGSLTLAIRDIALDCEVAKVGLEIQSVKADYRTDYRRMLEDITAYYTDLVLIQGSPVTQKLEIDNDTPQQTLYQRYAFLRSIVEGPNLKQAIHKIIMNPVRKWEESIVERNVSNVKRLSRRNMQQIATSRDRIPVEHGEQLGLPQGVNSVPRTLMVAYKRDTLDNQENQFVKFVLRSFCSFCSELREKKYANERLKAEIDNTMDILNGYLNTLFFKQVSMPSQLNLNSPVLQRKEGYREILQAWLMFDLAAKLSWKGGDNVYEAGKRNVAALYEYWLYFVLLDVVCDVFKLDSPDKKELVTQTADEINLELKQGKRVVVEGVDSTKERPLRVKLFYNRTFGHKQELSSSGSWTMPMRPDYTLSIWPDACGSETKAEEEDLIVHIHFDAKYRLNKFVVEEKDSNDDDIDNEDSELNKDLTKQKDEDELGEKTLGIYKREDLLKMHAYKDAIRRTSGAYVLYPGSESKQRRGFHEIIPGLGAFSIAPGKGNEQLEELKNFLREVRQHLLNRTSQREKMALHAYNTYKEEPTEESVLRESVPEAVGNYRSFMADETYVLVGYCNYDNYDFILNNGYNCRTGDRDGAIPMEEVMKASYLLLWSNKGQQSFHKLRKTEIYSQQKWIDKGYTTSSKPSPDDFYAVRKINKNGVEKEFKDVVFDVSKFAGNTKPFTIKLSDLLKNYKVINKHL